EGPLQQSSSALSTTQRGTTHNGTIRREFLDRLLFWSGMDLEMKLFAFRDYYNRYRSHCWPERIHSDRNAGVEECESHALSLAVTPSWAVPDTNRRVSTNLPSTGQKTLLRSDYRLRPGRCRSFLLVSWSWP